MKVLCITGYHQRKSGRSKDRALGYSIVERSRMRFYLLFYIVFNRQGILRWVVLQVEETSAYCTVNHWASASNYQLSNMKRPALDSNQLPQRLEARNLTTTPPSPPAAGCESVLPTLTECVLPNRYDLNQPSTRSLIP